MEQCATMTLRRVLKRMLLRSIFMVLCLGFVPAFLQEAVPREALCTQLALEPIHSANEGRAFQPGCAQLHLMRVDSRAPARGV